MQTQSIDDLKLAIPKIAEQIPYLKLLVLFGSRARGDHHIDSDWDFAALYDEEMRGEIANSGKLELLNIYSHLTSIFNIDPEKVEVVRLNDCTLAIAHVVARDGLLIYEKENTDFEKFRTKFLLSQEDLRKYQKQKIQSLKLAVNNWRANYGS